jgi:hypothetical protein
MHSYMPAAMIMILTVNACLVEEFYSTVCSISSWKLMFVLACTLPPDSESSPGLGLISCSDVVANLRQRQRQVQGAPYNTSKHACATASRSYIYSTWGKDAF